MYIIYWGGGGMICGRNAPFLFLLLYIQGWLMQTSNDLEALFIIFFFFMGGGKNTEKILLHFKDEIFAQEFEEEESSSAGYHTDESCSPTPEITNSRVIVVQQQSDYPLDAAVDFQTAYFYKLTARQLTDKYSALYAHAQLNTLRALDSLPQLKEASDLKIKILYSIVVVSDS